MTKQRMQTTRWSWDEGERISFSEQSPMERITRTSDRIHRSRCRVLRLCGDHVLLEILEDEIPEISKRTREGDAHTGLGVVKTCMTEWTRGDSCVARMRDLRALHKRTGSNNSGFLMACEAYIEHDQDEWRIPLIHQR